MHQTNLWIPFSHAFTWVINPSNTKTKQNKFFREIYFELGAQHLVSDVLWIVIKQLITQLRL